MKSIQLFSLLFILGVSNMTHAQSLQLNEGFTPIAILTAVDDIRDGLTTVESSGLWEAIYAEGFILETATYDVNKTAKSFFGLPVERIEVQTTWGYDEKLDEEYKSVFQFTLFMEAPSDEEYLAFMKRVEENYGYIASFTIHEDDTESPNWFNSITILTVSGKDSMKEVNGKKYVFATFTQAFGG